MPFFFGLERNGPQGTLRLCTDEKKISMGASAKSQGPHDRAERGGLDHFGEQTGSWDMPGVRHLIILAAVTLAAINRSLSQCTRFQGHLGCRGGH
jgi:hypothetical protein